MGNHYQDLAAALRAIADDLTTVTSVDHGPTYFAISIHPGGKTSEQKVDAVDAVATALVGKPGKTEHMSAGVYHHGANGERDGILVSVFDSVESPEKRALREELEQLRAERDALLATSDTTSDNGIVLDGIRTQLDG